MTNDLSADVAALHEIHQVFDRIFEMGLLAMAVVGPDFRFQRLNKRFCDLLGYSEDELKSLTFPQITHPDDIGLNVELAEKAFNNEIPYFTLEKRYVTKAGDTVWVNLTASCIRNDLGETIVGLAMIEDISERRAAEERISGLNQELETRVSELEVANDELAIANKELEAFSSSVSHDLKGPLISIAQFSQVLLNHDLGPLTDRQEDLLRRMRISGLQAKHIIDDLRDLADVTRREIFAEEVNISAMARLIIDDLVALAPDRDVMFIIRPDLRGYGDPALVRILLVNLLQNAWKYTAREDRTVIEMTCERGSLRNVFHIKDNGIGFDNAYRERIFEAFERLHSEKDFAGTGLGLATASRVARRHGGQVWAEGSPGEGATFSFSL
jgi:PAS domain S-box-containing protein